MQINDKFAEFLHKSSINRIPSLKMNIHVLIRAFADENMEPKELAAVLYHYPVIGARLLGLANSAWAKPLSAITHIEAACVRLGFATVKGVSLALAVASSFDTSRCLSFDPVRFWSTSMLVAECGGLLAAKLPGLANNSRDNFESTVQTAGILHNLGLLWLADNLAPETEQALKLTLSNPLLCVNQAIAECVGIDYCQAGAGLFKAWGLPDQLINVVAHHLAYPFPENTAPEVVLVGSAARMISTLFHDPDETIMLPDLDRLGIDSEQQKKVLRHLADKLASTQELAKTLFVS